MKPGWKAVIDRGLGDRKTRMLGCLLIGLGALGTLVLRQFANFEMVLAASLVAGSVLGRWWTVLVPMSVLAIVEPVLWGGSYAFYSSQVILGLTFFVFTGFLFVGIVGRSVKPRVMFRVGSVALLTTISIPMTIAYDLWTDVGEYYFIAHPMGLTFWNVLEAQVPFTLYHLLSSLIFAPLFGAGILILHALGWPHAHEETVPAEPADEP